MLRIFLIAIMIGLTSCQTTKVETIILDESTRVKPEKFQEISILQENDVWISNQYIPVNESENDIDIFVKERRRWIPEFYLVIDKKPQNGKDFVNSGKEGWTDLEVKDIEMNGVNFFNIVGYFNTLKSPEGEIQKLINQTPYSAPKCGLVSKLIPEDQAYSISIIDAISCGEFSLALRGEDMLNSLTDEYREALAPYLETLDQRINILSSEEKTAYGFM